MCCSARGVPVVAHVYTRFTILNDALRNFNCDKLRSSKNEGFSDVDITIGLVEPYTR